MKREMPGKFERKKLGEGNLVGGSQKLGYIVYMLCKYRRGRIISTCEVVVNLTGRSEKVINGDRRVHHG